jgi:hypothetical protein
VSGIELSSVTLAFVRRTILSNFTLPIRGGEFVGGAMERDLDAGEPASL